MLKTRNIFGHVKEKEGKLVSTLTGEEESFDEERCIHIRKSLTDYRNKLDKLKEIVINN